MTTNKIPTDEELAKAWFRRMKLLYKIPELENVLNWVGFRDIVDLLGEIRVAGREEQREKDAVLAEEEFKGSENGSLRYASFIISDVIRNDRVEAIRTQPTNKEEK